MRVLLAKTWDPSIDPTGWWMSEKLDGVRAVWKERNFISRLGNTFPVPHWFKADMPDTVLDGELWAGRGNFQDAVSIVRCGSRDNGWNRIYYRVFDAPEHGGTFEERLSFLEKLLPDHAEAKINPVTHTRCEGKDHLLRTLAEFNKLGAEGIMLRKPGSLYETCRSSTLLKVKTMHDDEAVVIEHIPGKGKHKGRLGALRCKLPSGVEFEVGTGFSDAERESPPRKGATISFRYQELTRDKVPRFPAFIGVRNYE